MRERPQNNRSSAVLPLQASARNRAAEPSVHSAAGSFRERMPGGSPGPAAWPGPLPSGEGTIHIGVKTFVLKIAQAKARTWPGLSYFGRNLVLTVLRGNHWKSFKHFHLQAQARIWPWLTCMCRIRSAAFAAQLAVFEKECRGEAQGPPLGQVHLPPYI